MDSLEKERDSVLKLYTEIRDHIIPSTDMRRLVDACEAVTIDIIKVAHERLSGIDDYDSEKVKTRLRELLDKDYAHSIYGSSVTLPSRHSSVRRSHSSSSVAAKRAEAAAELAAKEAEFEVLIEEKKQKENIQLLEERQRKELESQKRELERLTAEKELKAARARLKAYNEEIKNENSAHSADISGSVQQIPKVSAPAPTPNGRVESISPQQADVFYLAQAVQDSIAMNRLPMPEPSIFTGDPIQFIEWKASFIALIDKKNISPADKLHNLKKYVGGPARKTLDGIFYRNDSDAYKDAWERLNQRYGQSLFSTQR